MSQATRIDHLVAALKQAGVYPSDLEKPGCVNDDVRQAIKAFLSLKKGKGAKRVINAFRTISPECFSRVKSGDAVTFEVRGAVQAFLQQHEHCHVMVHGRDCPIGVSTV
jgi:hypothetical protein